MKRHLVFILALCFMLSMVSGCGTQTDEQVSSVSDAAPTQSVPAEETDAIISSEIVEPESSTEEISTAEAEAPETTISYPLEGGPYSLSIWQPLNGAFTMLISSYDELPSKQLVEEAIGVDITFIEPSEASASEQFNLIMASGEYPDLFSTASYSGGAAKAYSDGVILELSQLVPEAAPDYYSQLTANGEDILKNLLDDDGNMLYMTSVSDEYTYENGLVIRQDWLDELGLETPHTTSELKDVLTAFKSAYGCTNAFHVSSSGIMPYVYGAFGTASFDLSGTSGVDLGMYHVEDQVYCTISSEGYRDYLTYFKELYDDGLINQDFYSFVMSYDSMTNITVLGAAGIWDSMVDNFVSTTQQAVAETPNYRLMGIANIVKEDGMTNGFAAIPLTVSTYGTAISTTCASPEVAAAFVNWFFTDDGYMVGNYGIENESYVYDENGEPVFTDLIVNNPDGYNMMNIKNFYAFSYCASYTTQKPIQAYYTEDQLQTLEIWKTGSDYSNTLPGVTLTTAEAEEYGALASDIQSYAAETFLKFIVGEIPLDDEHWDEVQANLTDLGIERCVEIYQDAYDRYCSR